MALNTSCVHPERAELLLGAPGAAAAGFLAACAAIVLRGAASVAGARALAGRTRRVLRLG